MRDRVNSPTDGFESFHAPRLAPADGLESDASLFTAPPIESLELLRELGEIAAASFAMAETFMGSTADLVEAPVVTEPTAQAAAPVVAAPQTPAAPTAPKSADDRLLEALLEYHRLRGPKLGARTAPRPSGDFARVDASSADAGDRFASVEIPVVSDAIPKTTPGGIRSSRPVQTILKPKSRS